MSKTNSTGAFAKAVREDLSWGQTWNGAVCRTSTLSKCLDLFGRSGAMRNASVEDKQNLMREAYDEDPLAAMRLLFFTRDIRGGYGERDTFKDMVVWLANNHTDSVVKNLWAFLEYGRGKDLYALIGTKAEDAMWKFMKHQFEIDLDNMAKEKSVSLLAKWIATPDASSPKTKALGQLTLRKLGYSKRTERDYKKNLRALRKYLDIPEAKMATGRWAEIEYSKLASKCLLKHRNAFSRHDGTRYSEFIDKVTRGDAKMNMGAVNPCEIMHTAVNDYTADLDTMWANLPDYVTGNSLAIVDTSGSMYCGHPITAAEVATSLGIYIAEHNKGDLNGLFMTFSSRPQFVEITGTNLREKYNSIMSKSIVDDTNLEAAFELILDRAVRNHVAPDEMPMSLVVISDMQINHCVNGVNNGRMTFFDDMKLRFEAAGYTIPHVVFWNVNAQNPTFHAAKDSAGVSLVSGYSPAIFKTVMDNLNKTPMDLMLEVLNSDRYKDIAA